MCFARCGCPPAQHLGLTADERSNLAALHSLPPPALRIVDAANRFSPDALQHGEAAGGSSQR
jgi:hypothetical protein